MDIAYSVRGIPIRLTYERWYHIIENHDDLASYYHDVLETVETPDVVLQGSRGILRAARGFGKRRWMVVLYRETSKTDGFIITAYFLDKKPKGKVLWQRQ